MTELNLPWPPKELSPNARVSWQAAYRVKKAYREICFYLAKQANLTAPDGDTPFRLVLTFIPDCKRKRDRDNLLASMKAGLDGLADAMKVNDHRFDPVVRIAEPEVTKAVKVRVEA